MKKTVWRNMVVMVMSNLCDTFYRKCPHADILQETQEGFIQTSTLIMNYPATFLQIGV